ncbi:YciI family protein [Amycolatopsis sp. cmx-8-4]|uniref:YciI family protein n=1 Tax=Amycolatopsis sp. cmx-8-4 TaxID=2790947 RepID=UPI00397AE708
MPQFAVLVYDKPIAFEDIPPEVMAGHEAVPGKVEEAGGQFVTGYAIAPASEARSVRGDDVAKGPFHDTVQQLAGFFVISARDVDHAAELAKFVPAIDGGVEVRPLFGDPEAE